MPERPRLALLIDPRFHGGTSSAVAQEIAALGAVTDLQVCFLETRMFKGRGVHPRIAAALDAAGVIPVWNPQAVRAETVVFHNPSCLKFDAGLGMRITAAQLVVVTHENFLRPNGSPGFDVGHCLGLIAARRIVGAKLIAPVSPHNRRGVEAWRDANPGLSGPWRLSAADWFNICDFELTSPTDGPRDRRGRVSRPGGEKFPCRATMLRHFPANAERCAILGGDGFLNDPATLPNHWQVLPFGAADVRDFLGGIDFFVYFTHPLWKESFGRVIAEAIAAGKLVITDPGTAEIFGAGVVASDGTDVDAIIAALCADPASYQARVSQAQDGLRRFAPEAFRSRILPLLSEITQPELSDALL